MVNPMLFRVYGAKRGTFGMPRRFKLEKLLRKWLGVPSKKELEMASAEVFTKSDHAVGKRKTWTL